MVLFFENSHVYNHDFQTVSLAYFNRYPNPFAKHVLSSDTLEQSVDEDGCLRFTRLVVKTGRLPGFIKPFLGSNLDSWIIEKVVVDPKTQTLLSYTSNVDHRKFIRVEEYLKYSTVDPNSTLVEAKVKFSSNLMGFKQKIEEWSLKRFSSNMSNTREGLKFVMNRLKEKGGIWYKEVNIASQ
ncbi:MSF1-domain-containing protein [Suhomyces tanzawaensis NRRL Y-17324]|uniref:MSF1-domain-containing protein n=1 Tax=Suhomyces tanzawaensis NRRL Y-17324 TaxID=984487 RepID=A0A1E4SJD7_9ASCO|nr:MSF1-domain-containing protein [Suhomyces tanzawaensis NRRL Y-17324]ODV79619.1 MSF1-domain-containing protein [Suhomyces tanzawaensis NRRL Y-17324]